MTQNANRVERDQASSLSCRHNHGKPPSEPLPPPQLQERVDGSQLLPGANLPAAVVAAADCNCRRGRERAVAGQHYKLLLESRGLCCWLASSEDGSFIELAGQNIMNEMAKQRDCLFLTNCHYNNCNNDTKVNKSSIYINICSHPSTQYAPESPL